MSIPLFRPATPPDWATNVGARDPLSLPIGLRETGWVEGTVLPAKVGNSLWGSLADWAVYLSASVPALGELDIETIHVYRSNVIQAVLTTSTVGPDVIVELAGTGGEHTRISAGGGNKPALYMDATNTITAYDLTGGLIHWQSTAAGGFVGPRASADFTTGIRYGYPAASRPLVSYDYSPQSGGYMMWEDAGAGGATAITFATTAPRAAGLTNTSTTTPQVLRAVKPLHVPALTGQSTGWPELRGLSASFVGATDDLEVAVVATSRATGVRVDAAVINASNPVATFGAGVSVLNPTSLDFCVEIRSAAPEAALASTSDQVYGVLVELSHQAINPGI